MQDMWRRYSNQLSAVSCQLVAGFTLIEVLLSVAVIAVLAGISAPVFTRLATKNDLDTAFVSLAQTWRRGQELSMANDGDIVWGVKVAAGSITLFKGTSFASRDTNYDEVFSMPLTISVSGAVTEITFNKLTGTPSATGTVSLTSFDDTTTLTINSKGTVSF